MGLIRNAKETKQAIEFSGVKSGKMHPSDIDAAMEFNSEAIILMEVKKQGNRIPLGQKLLLQRIADKWEKAVVLKLEHTVYDPDETILLSECRVTYIYYEGKWSGVDTTIKDILTNLGNLWQIDKLIKLAKDI